MILPKIFVSHSSKQKKDFAEPIVKSVGRNLCFLDAYDFKPAYRTMDEILDKLNKSSIFLFLATKDSIKSPWCKNEIYKAQTAYYRGEIKLFLVYIVDPTVRIEDFPDWISTEECFNLKYFRSPRLIAADVNNKLRRLQWEQNQKLRDIEKLFVGRNHEIDDFQYQMALKRFATALIVSGRPGSGRESFAKRCLCDYKLADYEIPESVSLIRDDNIENLITQLNAITFLLSDRELGNLLISTEEMKLDALVEQLNEVFKYGHLFINDSRAIVRDGGHVAEWFLNLLNHERLNRELKMAVASVLKARAVYNSNQRLVSINLEELTERDRRIIFTEFIKKTGCTPLSNSDVDFFLSKALYSPSQLRKVAEMIANSGIEEAKRCLGAVEDKGRTLIADMLSEYKDRDDVIQFLILMSKLETTSYEALEQIYLEEFESLKNLIPDLIDSAIILPFGPSDSFIRIDSAVSDYISRSEMRLNKALKENLSSYIDNLVKAPAPSITEDLTTYMTTLREGYKRGLVKVEDMLLPSEALRTIINLYHEGKKESYTRVKQLCQDLLDKGHKINLNGDFRKNIIYWLCLALAHLGEETGFFKYVQDINGVQADFLKGFWFRQQGVYKTARVYYQKVLDSPYSVAKRRASTEMVIVQMLLFDYDGAFNLAQTLYREDSTNSYYTSVLFRASIKKKSWRNEEALQRELIRNMNRLLVKNAEQYVAAMELFMLVKYASVSREDKYGRISELQTIYKSKMIPYLEESIKDCLSELNR